MPTDVRRSLPGNIIVVRRTLQPDLQLSFAIHGLNPTADQMLTRAEQRGEKPTACNLFPKAIENCFDRGMSTGLNSGRQSPKRVKRRTHTAHRYKELKPQLSEVYIKLIISGMKV